MDDGRIKTKPGRSTQTAPSGALPVCFVIRVKGDASLIVAREYESALLSSEILTGEPRPAHTGQAALSGGRGSASVHTVAGIGSVVLRRYRRGGLIGKVLIDRYLSSSRPLRELDVLAFARSRGVSVPEVVGASSIRKGPLWHRGRIVTRLIPGSVTLPVFIGEKRDDARRVADVLKKAGEAIRLMHDAGIDHADLNMNNILVDKKGVVYIIDFDKATMHPELGRRRRLRNLRRLLRSLRKLNAARQSLDDGYFSMIIKGYAEDNQELLATIERATLRSRLLLFRSAIGRFLG
jgi:3-deoxy-D-manno-octulosonic acid kinase